MRKIDKADKALSRRSLVDMGALSVVLVDSITQILPQDAGRVVVTGSHGGLSAASFAVSIRACLYIFNDAGIGKQEAGVAGLPVLDRKGIAAVAVSHDTARIGDALDTLENGVISRLNRTAQEYGLVPGGHVKAILQSGRFPP